MGLLSSQSTHAHHPSPCCPGQPRCSAQPRVLNQVAQPPRLLVRPAIRALRMGVQPVPTARAPSGRPLRHTNPKEGFPRSVMLHLTCCTVLHAAWFCMLHRFPRKYHAFGHTPSQGAKAMSFIMLSYPHAREPLTLLAETLTFLTVGAFHASTRTFSLVVKSIGRMHGCRKSR